jgi:hypothetical protein
MLARLGLCICLLISVVGTAALHATDVPALVQKAKPAVVEILTFDQQDNLLKTGTGFFISPDGLLLTNFHVISGASSIMAKTPTGAVYFLKSVLSASKTYDIAELQFFATEVPYLSLGSSSGAVEGQRVLVIGNPEGLEGTVSDGIISAFRDNRSMIQITAPMSSGSSGSPVLDEAGNVIGIVKQMLKEGQNLNFAISSESIQDAIAKSAVVTPNPSVSAATPAPTQTVVATPTPSVATSTQSPTTVGAKWPDGRILSHPEHFVQTGVVNVARNDKLELRSGPGTRFAPITKIPADATGVSAFDRDAVWDGDTWWYPVERQGFRGYVGGHYLPHNQ